MYTIKEKVTEKLSRFFADSPNTSTPSMNSRFEDPQVRQYSKGGKSMTSFFSFVVPLVGSDGSKTSQQYPKLKQIRSLPCRQISDDFDQLNEPMDKYEESRTCCPIGQNEPNSPFSMNKQVSSVNENKQTDIVNDDEKDCASGTEAIDLCNPTKLLNLMDDSAFITSELYEFLQSSIPNIVKGRQFVLLYSTLKHGISLRTLIRKSADLSGPCLLIVGDMQGAVFGGLLECPLKPTPKRKYQGTNQTFVFTTKYGEPRLFRPTGTNRYYYMCLNDLLVLGGGGNFALCLEGDLLTGTSGPCETFGNLCLAHNQEFELKNVELWGFSHVSHYLTCSHG